MCKWWHVLQLEVPSSTGPAFCGSSRREWIGTCLVLPRPASTAPGTDCSTPRWRVVGAERANEWSSRSSDTSSTMTEGRRRSWPFSTGTFKGMLNLLAGLLGLLYPAFASTARIPRGNFPLATGGIPHSVALRCCERVDSRTLPCWHRECLRQRAMKHSIQTHHGLRSLSLCATLLAACHASSPQTATVDSTARARLTTDSAAGQIADARCDHELACEAVGGGHAYSARDQCASEFFRSTQADLAAQPCTNGIAARRVADCAGRLRQESCHPLSTLSRMYACRPAALCLPAATTEFTTEDVYGQ
jgi:hypothetical protein